MKWDVVRAAIGVEMRYAAYGTTEILHPCFSGNIDDGLRYSELHSQFEHGVVEPEKMQHVYLPPVTKDRKGTGYVEDSRGGHIKEFDLWGSYSDTGPHELDPVGMYRKWYDRTEKTFNGWDQVEPGSDGMSIPDERAFWNAAEKLKAVIKPLGDLNLPGESYYTACRHFGLITRDPGPDSTTPPERLFAPAINGPIDRFIIPLQGTVLNFFYLGELLAAQLEALGKMWHSARRSVMEIGLQTARKIDDPGGGVPEAVINTAGWVTATVGLIPVPTPVTIGVAAAGLFIQAASTIHSSIEKKEVGDVKAAIDGIEPNEILAGAYKALNSEEKNMQSVERMVEEDEQDCYEMLDVALRRFVEDRMVLDPTKGTYSTCFTMKPEDGQDVTVDTHPKTPADVDIDVEIKRLRDGGVILSDEFGAELAQAARGLREVFPGTDDTAWRRPEMPGGKVIGLGTSGPWEKWRAVRDELANALDQTSQQVIAVGDLMVSAANAIERKDAEAEAAFRKQVQTVNDII